MRCFSSFAVQRGVCFYHEFLGSPLSVSLHTLTITPRDLLIHRVGRIDIMEEEPRWHQKVRAKIKQTDRRTILSIAGATTIYISAILLMIILPVKLIPNRNGNSSADPVVANNNSLPSSCPAYPSAANGAGTPLSNGPLGLPFQRPTVSCRTFTSAVMETLIANVTGRMVDKDLARLFENAYPNTLGTNSLVVPAYCRHNYLMVLIRRSEPSQLCHNRRHPRNVAP